MGWHFNRVVEWVWHKYFQLERSQDAAHLRKCFLRYLRTLSFSVSSAVWDLKHYILYLEKNHSFHGNNECTVKNAFSPPHTFLPLPHAIQQDYKQEHMLLLSPPSAFPSSGDRRYLQWQLWSSEFHRQAWLIAQVVNQDINKVLSRGLQGLTSSELSLPLDSSNVKLLAPGLLGDGWSPAPHSLAPAGCRQRF